MAEATVALSQDFLKAFSDLPLKIQGKVSEFINKFKQDPRNPGLHLEKINNPYDDKFYSGRVDLTYRVILAMQASTQTFILLWVDHHDEAYNWIAKKKIVINKITGVIQLFDIVEKTQEQVVNKIFDKFTDDQLLSLGLPELQLPFVRSIVTTEQFYENENSFSDDIKEYLSYLVEGVDYNEVKALISDTESTPETEDLGEALRNPYNARSYVIVDDDDELNAMLDAPLEKWRVFLHPKQREIINKDYSGPARVSGEAGTGKTVVAMHRAKYLTHKGNKVLYTTFTKNLVADVKTNIKSIMDFDDLSNLKIETTDSVIISFLNKNKINITPEYDDNNLLNYWANAIERAHNGLDLDASFYMEEWRNIASVMDDLSVEKYISVPRIGRGIRLDRMKRLKVWHVFEEYMEILNQTIYWDIDYATYKARCILRHADIHPYDSIIIDEGQDISTNAYKFLRMLSGEEHVNDLFIVGDPHQRIYKNKAVLSKCGINVRGRSNILKVNYRTTEETRKYAYAFLKGINFDDLDNEFNENTQCISITHGDNPYVKNFDSFNEEMQYAIEEIKNLHENGVNYDDICVVARTHSIINNANRLLNDNGITTFEIKTSDNSMQSGVRLATMHRVKGLEFRYIFVVSVNENIIPKITENKDSKDNDDNLIIERCLLYVTITRAQVKAYVLSDGKPSKFL